MIDADCHPSKASWNFEGSVIPIFMRSFEGINNHRSVKMQGKMNGRRGF